MLSRSDLTRLGLAEKRQIARAFLQNLRKAPRSFPLSYNQEQLWFMDKLQPGSPVYNIPLYIPFQGPFNVAALKSALEILTRRHDMLRAHFGTLDDEPVQIIEPEVAVDLPVEDLSGQPVEQRDAALGELLNAEVQRPFDLSGANCVRYRLFRLDAANHLLSATFHHIITDAFSLGIFVRELNIAYGAHGRGGAHATLAPLQAEYSDYARWQRAYLHGLRMRKLVDYWTGKLSGAPQILNLPTDHPRSIDQTFNGTVVGFMLEDELSEALIALSRRHNVTLFMLLLTCYYILLYRYTGQEDIIVGIPVANRGHPELEAIIGLFVNTLIIRVKLQDNREFSSVLKEVRETSLEAFEHQMLPFGKLIDELNLERVPGYPPLYQAVFNFQNASLIESSNPRAEGETMMKRDFPFVHSNTSKVDLNFTVTQSDSTISGGMEYNTDLFDRETIDEMISHFKTIAEKVAVDPTVQILDIALTAADPAAELSLQTDRADQVPHLQTGEFNFELNS